MARKVFGATAQLNSAPVLRANWFIRLLFLLRRIWFSRAWPSRHPSPDTASPGYIHFAAAENFDLEYFKQLIASEIRERRMRAGVPYSVYKQIRDRNEALDMTVGNLAIRRSLHPRLRCQGGLDGYTVARITINDADGAGVIYYEGRQRDETYSAGWES